MIISEKSYVIILMIKHPTDNLDHQTKPTNTKQTSLIIKQTILKTNQPTLDVLQGTALLVLTAPEGT